MLWLTALFAMSVGAAAQNYDVQMTPGVENVSNNIMGDLQVTAQISIPFGVPDGSYGVQINGDTFAVLNWAGGVLSVLRGGAFVPVPNPPEADVQLFASVWHDLGYSYTIQNPIDYTITVSGPAEYPFQGLQIAEVSEMNSGSWNFSNRVNSTVTSTGAILPLNIPGGCDPGAHTHCDIKQGGDQTPCHGMATYSFFALLASLTIEDRPLTYAPAFGPPIDFTITYNHRTTDDWVNSAGTGNFGPNGRATGFLR